MYRFVNEFSNLLGAALLDSSLSLHQQAWCSKTNKFRVFLLPRFLWNKTTVTPSHTSLLRTSQSSLHVTLSSINLTWCARHGQNLWTLRAVQNAAAHQPVRHILWYAALSNVMETTKTTQTERIPLMLNFVNFCNTNAIYKPPSTCSSVLLGPQFLSETVVAHLCEANDVRSRSLKQ